MPRDGSGACVHGTPLIGRGVHVGAVGEQQLCERVPAVGGGVMQRRHAATQTDTPARRMTRL
jgi:hypothetical protein